MWTCPKCGEKIEDQFDSCWKCAAQPEQTVPSSLVSRRGKRAFLFGILFEIVLILLCFLLPESWLQIKVRNFLIITHFPLMFVMEGLRLGGGAVSVILCLLIALAVMASVWGFLIFLVTRLIKRVLVRFIVSQRQKLVLRYSFGFLSMVILLWVIMANWPATPIPFAASPEVKSTVDGNTAFALDLYQKLKDRPGNLFFSPYSISTSLAMTYAGARGQTEGEMAKVLHFNLAQTNLPVAFGTLGTRMNQIQRWNRITLTTANSLWCQQDYRFTDAFLNLIHKYYDAEARRVDFKRSPQAASGEINKWVEQRTKGKIRDAVEPGLFTDYTRLVLCNAIYFKGKWQHQFKLRDTEPAPFHITTNETVTVPMMSQKAHFKTASSNDRSVELLELPYSGTDLSMIILLPEIEYPSPDVEQPGLPGLERKLTADNLRVWLANLDQANPHETRVALPRFTTSCGFELTKELKSLGMASAFDDLTANFYGMDGTTNLVISDVIHKAFVEVNESGTEAAAVTLTMARTKGMARRFIVDHPFIFLIRENGSGSILFLGRIVDPTK
jgi:serine protease inhibitor